ncbi:MAG: hypothetical protein Q9M28_11945 [Mariprofundaceae bacterium]|nr:hypothetical protein [Mariprofundaceae bacterium]
MKKIMIVFFLVSTNWLAGCNMHDGKGWEHTGNENTDTVSSPYILEHKH